MQYLVAAYGIALATLALYAANLIRESRALRRQLARPPDRDRG